MATPVSPDEKVWKILIGCTGSVASIKVPVLIEQLQRLHYPVEIKVVATEKSLHFFDQTSIGVPVHTDDGEWTNWQKIGDPILHIELRRWADILIIAPLDANTLAKIATGICDNLLTCLVRAWDRTKPLLFAPAMNTAMYDHPLTSQQIVILQSFDYVLIPSVVKTLACGETGNGAMAEVCTIVENITSILEKGGSMKDSQ